MNRYIWEGWQSLGKSETFLNYVVQVKIELSYQVNLILQN